MLLPTNIFSHFFFNFLHKILISVSSISLYSLLSRKTLVMCIRIQSLVFGMCINCIHYTSSIEYISITFEAPQVLPFYLYFPHFSPPWFFYLHSFLLPRMSCSVSPLQTRMFHLIIWMYLSLVFSKLEHSIWFSIEQHSVV